MVFDGPMPSGHTSPVDVRVAGQPIVSREDAEFYVEWIDQLS
jgi:hypothetical protein